MDTASQPNHSYSNVPYGTESYVGAAVETFGFGVIGVGISIAVIGSFIVIAGKLIKRLGA